MRYELYTFADYDKGGVYHFITESDDMNDINSFIDALNEEMFEYIEEATSYGWVLINNEPTEFKVSHFGFTEIPYLDDIKRRIQECKFQKLFPKSNNLDDFEDFEKYGLIHQETVKKANEETEKLIEKLLCFSPKI